MVDQTCLCSLPKTCSMHNRPALTKLYVPDVSMRFPHEIYPAHRAGAGLWIVVDVFENIV